MSIGQALTITAAIFVFTIGLLLYGFLIALAGQVLARVLGVVLDVVDPLIVRLRAALEVNHG